MKLGKGRPSLPRPVSTGIDPEFTNDLSLWKESNGMDANLDASGLRFNWGLGPGDHGRYQTLNHKQEIPTNTIIDTHTAMVVVNKYFILFF
jgi:hypothetical protein